MALKMLSNKIESLIGKKNENIAELIYLLMRYLHQPYSEILKIPLPLAQELIKLFEKEAKEARRKK